MVERVNVEIKRRSKVVGAFPNQNSVIRLIGSILMEMNEEWITSKRYLNMNEVEESGPVNGQINSCRNNIC